MRTFKLWSPDAATGVEAGYGTEHDDGTVVVTVYGAGDITYTTGHNSIEDVEAKIAAWPGSTAEVVWD